MLVEMDNSERLPNAMQKLPQRLQLVLQLFFVEELNLIEISEILEVSVPRVHQLRGQALNRLRGLLSNLEQYRPAQVASPAFRCRIPALLSCNPAAN